MAKTGFLLVFVGLFAAVAASACSTKEPRDLSQAQLLKVGQTVVTMQDFVDAVLLRGGPGMVPESSSGDFQRYREVLIRTLTVESLLREEARTRGLHVDAGEVDDELQMTRERYPDDFDAYIQGRFGSVERYRELLAHRALSESCERVIRKELSVDSRSEPATIEAYFEAHRQDFAEPTRGKVMQLAAPEKEQVDALRSRLLNGDDPETLANEARSLGGEGGVMGWFEEGSMPPWFEDNVWPNKNGRVSRVVEADGLFRVLQVLEYVPAQEPELERVRDMIERRLQLERVDERFADWVDERLAELRLHSDRNLIAAMTCCKNGLPYIAPEAL